MRAALLPFVLLSVLAAGCGDAPRASAPAGAPRPTTTAPDPVPQGRAAAPADARVVRAWTDAERRGRFDDAVALFRLPVTWANGGPKLRAGTPGALRLLHSDLPCGATFVRASRVGRYTVGTLRLTDRTGSQCDAAGRLVRTAFLIEDGRIREWRRLPDPPQSGDGDAPAGPVV